MIQESALSNYDGINQFKYDYYPENGCVELTEEIVFRLNRLCSEMEHHLIPLISFTRFQDKMLGFHIHHLRLCMDSHYDSDVNERSRYL